MAKSRSSASAKSPAPRKETTITSRATRRSAKKQNTSDDTGDLNAPEGDSHILSKDTVEDSPEIEQPDEIELTGAKKIREGMRRSEYKQISAILNNPLYTYYKWEAFRKKIQTKYPNLALELIQKHDGVVRILEREQAHLKAIYDRQKGRGQRKADQDEEEESSEDETEDEDDEDDTLSIDGETGDRVKWPRDNDPVPHQDRWFGIQPDQRTRDNEATTFQQLNQGTGGAVPHRRFFLLS
jgi:phosphopantothenoylcysteine synthetase/decarboxylase